MDNKSLPDVPGDLRRYSAWFGDSLRLPRGRRFRPRNQLWVRAEQQIASLLNTLKARNAADLHQLLETPLTYELCEERLVARITAHAHVENSGALAVIVEARQVCWGGFMDTISADGFYLEPDGTIAPMKEADLWKHGY